MSELNCLHEGLGVLLKYGDPVNNGCVSAEHDQMWFGGPEPDTMEAPDPIRLEALGFFWDEEYECWSMFTQRRMNNVENVILVDCVLGDIGTSEH